MMNLHGFLVKNKEEILFMTEAKSLALAGPLPSSDLLKNGLPIFFQQLLEILQMERQVRSQEPLSKGAAVKAASDSDEQSLSQALGKPEEGKIAKSGGIHGTEMLRLGYTLSHIVHAYGAICQSITELAYKKNINISAEAFHDLNQCLDVAIAGAVTEYQSIRNAQEKEREVTHLGFLVHEMRNALSSASISFQMIKRGAVGFGGSTSKVLENSLKLMQGLIDRSLNEVKLRVDPQVDFESASLQMIVNQILETARVEAESKNLKIEIRIEQNLIIHADQQAFYSALSNLIQNAIKFTHDGSNIQVRGKAVGDKTIVEIEDECGGLKTDAADELFKAFEQKNENRIGLGLGLTIAQRAIELNHGTIEARNVAGKGCVFKITLPNTHEKKTLLEKKNNLRDLEA